MAEPTPCSVDGCGKPVASRGMCDRHYRQKKRAGELKPRISSAVAQPGEVLCKVDQCANAARPTRLGYCERHYASARAAQLLAGADANLCKVEACGGLVAGLGYCGKHYQRLKSRGTVEAQPPKEKPGCAVNDCNKPHLAKGLCGAHYSAMKAAEPDDTAFTEEAYGAFKVKIGSPNDSESCHPWAGHRRKGGYGNFHYRNKSYIASRWILGYLRGMPLSADEWALHHCDNPPCVNPLHLYIGDAQQNNDDMVRRERARGPAAKTHCPRGHLYAGDTLYIIPSTGGRICRSCQADRRRKAA